MKNQRKTTRFTKIGNAPDEDDESGVFSLDLSDLKAVDPSSYFITSGEAVAKAERLDADAWILAGKCRKLLGQLKKARGDSKYLEVTHELGEIVCRRKDPRKRGKGAD